ncbi:MAG: hypothetical protein ACN4GT_13895 [Gammaproteobacteria bacterium]
MGFVNSITTVMDFSQRSLENTMDTIKEVHQTIVEIPINIAEELGGLPKEQADVLKTKHRLVLDHVHDGIVGAVGEVNQYIVKQAQAVNDMARAQWDPPKPRVVDFETKKGSGREKKTG